MKIWKFPDQVVRLAIVFIVLGGTMIGIRSQFVPESYGELGAYRADAITEVASQEVKYAGWQVCVMCHVDEGEKKVRSYHRSLSCEVCHGAANKHTEEPDTVKPVIPVGRAGCMPCHSYLSSRPTGFPQIVEIEHNPRQPCADCHDPHDPTPPEIPETCSACHAQIARTKAVSHHSSLECESCHETSANHKEAPRSNLPGKPAENTFCGQCHASGADSARNIPRVDLDTHGGRYLCWQCHYPHFPEGR